MTMLRYSLKSTRGTTGELAFDEEKDIWLFRRNPGYDGDAPIFIKSADMQNREIDPEHIKAWVHSRAPEPGYQLLGVLMREIGITEYDPIAFFKAYDGRMNSDEFYVEEI
jgi:hypothetical protein